MEQIGKIGMMVGRVSAGAELLHATPSAKRWENYFMDPRNDLKEIQTTAKDGVYFVDFICYGDKVALYVICRVIAGRAGDCVMAMITIPCNVAIPGEELAYIIDKTKEELGKTQLDFKAFDQLCDTEYKLLTSPLYVNSSSFSRQQYAYQLYGRGTDYQLKEILSKNLFNPCYNGYKAVFLIDKASLDVMTPVEGVVELQQSQVGRYAVLKYPVGYRYKLTINGQAFTADYPAKLGDTVTITASRESFVAQSISVTINSQSEDPTSQLNAIKWKTIIKLSMFEVLDQEKGTPLKDIQVRIGDTEIKPEGTPVLESVLQNNPTVTIECKGYNTGTFFYNTLRENQQRGRKIKLTRAPKTYTYVVDNRLEEGRKITFAIEDARFDIKRSPLAYYEVEPSTLNSEKIYLRRRKQRLTKSQLYVILLISIVVFLLGGWAGWGLSGVIAKYQQRETVETYAVKTQSNDPARAEKSGSSTSDAEKEQADTKQKIKELLKNTLWSRSEFKEAGYENLYDALNGYDFTIVLAIYNSLGVDPDSVGKTWRSIIENMTEINAKGINVTRDPIGNAGAIDLIQYNNILKDILKAKPKPSTGGSSSKKDGAKNSPAKPVKPETPQKKEIGGLE